MELFEKKSHMMTVIKKTVFYALDY